MVDKRTLEFILSDQKEELEAKAINCGHCRMRKRHKFPTPAKNIV